MNNDVLTTLYRSMYVAASTCAAHPEARREWEAKHRNDLALVRARAAEQAGLMSLQTLPQEPHWRRAPFTCQ